MQRQHPVQHIVTFVSADFPIAPHNRPLKRVPDPMHHARLKGDLIPVEAALVKEKSKRRIAVCFSIAQQRNMPLSLLSVQVNFNGFVTVIELVGAPYIVGQRRIRLSPYRPASSHPALAAATVQRGR